MIKIHRRPYLMVLCLLNTDQKMLLIEGQMDEYIQ